jgi:hypothetical protein
MIGRPIGNPHSSATRAGGPTGEFPSRERNVLHVLRRNERHDGSSLPLASGDHEFINRSL